MDKKPTESSWIRIKGRAGTDDVIVGSATGHLTSKAERTRPSVGR